MKFVVFVCLFIAVGSATIFFEDDFTGAEWESRWVHSTNDGDGKFVLGLGEFFGDEVKSKGIKTSQDAKFYHLSTKAPAPFSNEGKDLVFQFTVKHEQGIDCGGGYAKVLPSGLDQEGFNGDSEYNIMFGPDICGATKKVHLIFTYKGKNLLWKKAPQCKSDQLTHLYTAIIHPDNTYEVQIDSKQVESGSLFDDWDFLPPKEILDPEQSKPADWVDDAQIDDPEEVKPEGWDDIPEFIFDPDAVEPSDWDAEMDGEWEAPQIVNPEYKGPWEAKKIPNPEYKGEWVHPKIANPEYFEDDKVYLFPEMEFVGLDLWQVKSGSIFDNFLITDDIAEAAAKAAKIQELMDKEKELFDAAAEEKRLKEEEERKKRLEDEKKAEEADSDDDESDDESDDEADTKDEL